MQEMMDQAGESAGCLIIVGLLLAEIVGSLWILAELLT